MIRRGSADGEPAGCLCHNSAVKPEPRSASLLLGIAALVIALAAGYFLIKGRRPAGAE